VEQGRVTEERIDVSVRRLLRKSSYSGCSTIRTLILIMRLPLLARPSFVASGADAQRRAYTLLTKHNQILLLKRGILLCPERPPWKQAARTFRSTPWTRSSDSVTDCATANPHRAVRRLNALRFHGE
jgi:hypothetical protein